ncbi:TnsA-like heteromeric transposase endonuclease subunit [Streptomyces sp. NBC_01622]|uniref:TnsA-like heteromeric transposase endonuclease subunit n=1 Tax=Streptomyces sp. NBC_01622 TaxID=2975903 RepID=UPI00386CC5BD
MAVATEAVFFGSETEPRFEVAFVDGTGKRQRRSLRSCVTERFEDVQPVRPFRWSRGDRHFSGWYWAVTVDRHVGYESWLERDRLILLDFDPLVTGMASQPFWLHWHDGERERRHAPDYFVRRQDGSALVVDVRADERIEPKDAAAFEVTRGACARAGWEFERVGTPAPVLMANVRWLSRYRHSRCFREDIATALRSMFALPCPLLEGARLVGETLVTLPVLFHLLWRHELAADLSGHLLGPATQVRSGPAVGR